MIDFKQKMEELERQERRQNGNFADEELFIASKKRKRIVTYTIAIIVLALIFSGRILMSSQSATNWIPGISFLNKLRHLVPSGDKQLQGEENDRVNILLLGMGGEGHDGAYLTDTIMLTSLKPSTKQVAFFSLPRDLVSPVSNWRKINSINAYAEQKNPGSGSQATTEALGTLLEEPIHYYIRADFEGFKRVIDELGGVTVNVENSFDDYSYPAEGQEDNPNYNARFEHLHFESGPTKMNGTLALKYARSRHAFGQEGSDFARARRQQLLLEAVKDKLLSMQTLLNPVVIAKLVNEFNKDVSTNLSAWEILRLWDLTKNIDRANIINKVFSDAPDGFLVSDKGEDGAYILRPRSGNFGEINRAIENIFSDPTPSGSTVNSTVNIMRSNEINKTATKTEAEISPVDDLPLETATTSQEHTGVIVYNGTWINGLAGKLASKLSNRGLNVIKTGNAVLRDQTQTTYYDLTDGAKNDDLETIKKISGAEEAVDSPSWLETLKADTDNRPDFVIIVGTDSNLKE